GGRRRRTCRALRAFRARSAALAHARCHPRDGSFAAAHRAARGARELARAPRAERHGATGTRAVRRGELGYGARPRTWRARTGTAAVRVIVDFRRFVRLVI